MSEEKDYEVGFKKPPKNRQFGQPGGNKAGRGFFKKENTPRYQLEQLMQMNEEQLQSIFKDKSQPVMKRRMAKFIVSGDWKTYSDQINQVYGKPKENVEHTVNVPKGIELTILTPKDNSKTNETKQ
uniref:hypothetical protein n=1 Tax=Alloprevotella sp. TaxID=1872471 RepID=UPI003FEED9D5